ncbi:MAG: SDR family NAD(P)-dependent oxidoreductase, partial [bacterium]|nr:SDR family NAD(P)-dependent oxidoreductase [bacterium]
LHTSHAFHSGMMEPILEKFTAKVREIGPGKPRVPYISNLTGKWITVEAAADPGYWAAHLRQTVRFAGGIKELLEKENTVFIEVGPGNVLSESLRKNAAKGTTPKSICLLRHPKEKIPDGYFLQKAIGQMWLYGGRINWKRFYGSEKRRRIPLPTYPFEKKCFSIDIKTAAGPGTAAGASPSTGKKEVEEWFYIPTWKRIPLDQSGEGALPAPWLVFCEDEGLGKALVKKMEQDGVQAVIVTQGARYHVVSEKEYIIDGTLDTDYLRLIRELRQTDRYPGGIIHLWGAGTPNDKLPLKERINRAADSGFYSVLYLARALGEQQLQTRLIVVTGHAHQVTGYETVIPENAPVLGLLNVIPVEYPHIRCCNIDIPTPTNRGDRGGEDELIEMLAADAAVVKPAAVLAYRGNFRWEREFLHKTPGKTEKPTTPSNPLKEGGVYLVTGGTGKIGLLLAEHLARSVGAKLLLTGRTALPPGEEWEWWLEQNTPDHPDYKRIKKLRELEQAGAEVLVLTADAADLEAMKEVLHHGEQRFGSIDGVIHAAGLTGGDSFRIIKETRKAECEKQFRAKIFGTLVLEELLQGKKLDFRVMISSLSSLLGGVGFAAYAAANAFMDALAQKNGPVARGGWRTINWDGWDFSQKKTEGSKGNLQYELGIKPGEGIEAFKYLLAMKKEPQVVVSTMDLQERLSKRIGIEEFALPGEPEENEPAAVSSRPNLLTPYTPPRTQLEKDLAKTWEKFMGIDKVGINDNFFELGITSLDLLRLNTRLKKELNRNLPIVLLYEYPTIKKLAAYLEKEETGDSKNENISPKAPARAEMINKGKNKMKQMKKKVNVKGRKQ